jgi:hypothetical protein
MAGGNAHQRSVEKARSSSIENRILGIVTSILGAGIAAQQEQPFYEKGSFWGCITTAISIILMVIAARLRDVRWLLFLALPFAVLAWFVACKPLKASRLHWRRVLSGFLTVATAAGLVVLYLKLPHPEKSPVVVVTPPAPTSTPSFMFVLGSPLGDNDSPRWVMLLRHYGSGPAYNCESVFSDLDRDNIAHTWLVDHPGYSFAPPSLVGNSSAYSHLSELDATAWPPHVFYWSPIDPDNQHYSVGINCRDGEFQESWEVRRIDGLLRTSIRLSRVTQMGTGKTPKVDTLFKCVDPQFSSSPVLAKLPKRRNRGNFNPGWKPNHLFEAPVMILDPNGNLQFMVGAHGKKIDLGCWALLQKHAGD